MKINMKITLTVGNVILKNFDFKDGTIEFDAEPAIRSMAPLLFRWNDTANTECFYLRSYRAGNSRANDAVQYAPVIKGAWLWDMYHHYQAGADLKANEWNHVKLVVSGKQMRAYVNDMINPVLVVPQLEADVTNGTIGFGGEMVITNLVIKPGQVEGIDPTEGMDEALNDKRLIRNWQVTMPVNIPPGVDFSNDLYPTKETRWEPIKSERKGLVNLSRKFGKSERRRIVWLKTTIHSGAATNKLLDLGYSDEIWVQLNGKLVFTGKNDYRLPIRKEPDGRISLDNGSASLPLLAGDNELLIGVANDFFGWGLIARLQMKESDVY